MRLSIFNNRKKGEKYEIRAAIAAALCAAAVLPSWAAMNITEDVMLTEDVDRREHG